MCKVRVKEFKCLAQVHNSCNWQIWGSNTGLPPSRTMTSWGASLQFSFSALPQILTSVCIWEPSLEILIGLVMVSFVQAFSLPLVTLDCTLILSSFAVMAHSNAKNLALGKQFLSTSFGTLKTRGLILRQLWFLV